MTCRIHIKIVTGLFFGFGLVWVFWFGFLVVWGFFPPQLAKVIIFRVGNTGQPRVNSGDDLILDVALLKIIVSFNGI